MTELTVEKAITWLTLFHDKIQANKAYLSELDTPIGDGDHGNNMARGMTAVMASLADKTPDTLQDVFKQTAMALISKVGGASGPLYGTAFLEMAKSAATTSDLSVLLASGLAGIEKRGGAVLGDKTMLDVWVPVLPEIAAGSLTAIEIDEFVMATAPLVAKKGRASYLGERSKDHIDPGSQSSGYLFESLLEAIA
ncbi:dihydroxyacetone kinase subunit DhaL [Pseudolactococcus insecticola]|uniref:phosphoenolpyruvate--glycerone phosphotransferase n=1 Tax=Pseudolactococcus insecticola TaxID=2709158 RepID=A0A6A0B855_9LACT|nr:dihydroxyacetone kinase subunit DhaL [Lactococcus insecticola]GFH39977.1 dihydroxyacetone kinase subunit L [Lactococcus insecticola]